MADERGTWRERLRIVIFGHETPSGKAFDVALILAILASVAAVMLESVASVRARHGDLLLAAEWTFTLLFTFEYVLRLVCSDRPGRYARSFFGVIDLLAILPTYVSAIAPGAQALLVIRILRILRAFRVLKLGTYISEMDVLSRALLASRRKISVFLTAVATLVVVLGSLMYLIEGPEHGFTSIPAGVYWAIVTLTTVGYGDISPETPGGQALASVIMVLGYGIIAVPTGIVSVELSRARAAERPLLNCPRCRTEELEHASDAAFCRRCGAELA